MKVPQVILNEQDSAHNYALVEDEMIVVPIDIIKKHFIDQDTEYVTKKQFDTMAKVWRYKLKKLLINFESGKSDIDDVENFVASLINPVNIVTEEQYVTKKEFDAMAEVVKLHIKRIDKLENPPVR